MRRISFHEQSTKVMTMDPVKSKKIAKQLTILWLVTFLLASIITGIHHWSAIIKTGESSLGLLSAGHIIITVLVSFYFIPLLFTIRKHAKASQMKGTAVFTLLFLIHHIFWLVLNIITMLHTIIIQ